MSAPRYARSVALISLMSPLALAVAAEVSPKAQAEYLQLPDTLVQGQSPVEATEQIGRAHV